MTAKGDNCVEAVQNPETVDDDGGYFLSYGDIDVHELMLKDKPRTVAYQNFIENNRDIFKDKFVIDVGAGTGILSLFAARAGARKVLAVEASDIAAACKQIVCQNCFENIITVLHKRVEDVVLPPGERADILISEWMGFYLLHESMLDSVIYARDNLLKENGLIFPSKATIYLSPVNLAAEYAEKFEFWKNVYGFDYSPLIPSVVIKSLQSPSIVSVSSNSILGDPQKVMEFDLHNVTLDQVTSFQKIFSFPSEISCKVHGFVTWFDVEFTSPLKSELSEILSTSPKSSPTHWKQTVINLPAPLLADANDVIKCRLELSQSAGNKRWYNITLELLDVPPMGEDPCINGIEQTSSNGAPENEDSLINEDSVIDCEDSDTSSEDHPTPCDCDAPRCKIIKALVAKYDEEDAMLEKEGIVDISPEELDKAVDISDSLDT